MRAIVVDRLMTPDQLALQQAPDPVAGPGEVVLSVRAAACNFFDILQVQGKYQERRPLPFVPGAECAGVVESLGPGVTGVAVGDRVMAGLIYGAYAERVAVPASRLLAMPEAMTFAQAAAFPVVYETSYAALTLRGQVKSGDTVLVTAAAGGVGLAAVEIAKALGARVIAVAGGEAKLAAARSRGADEIVDYLVEGWHKRVLELTGGRGADVIIESVGGDVFQGCVRCLAWSGRLVVVGFAGGTIPEVSVNRLLLRNASVVGLFLGTYVQQQPAELRAVDDALLALFREGKLRPLIWRTYPLSHAAEALGALGRRETVGKVVLEIHPGDGDAGALEAGRTGRADLDGAAR